MNFFTPEPLLDSRAGFPLYGAGHLCALAACLALVAWLCRRYCGASPTRRRRWQCGVGNAVMLCEGLRMGNFLLHGCLSVRYLPLHLCSLAVFLTFAHTHRPEEKLGELLYCAGMPGALLALLFPNWGCYDVWQFHSLLAFLSHALLVAYPLMLVLGGTLRPRVRRLPGCLGQLCVMAGAVYVFNALFDTNYMFLRRPSPGSPLAWFAAWWGEPWYLLGYVPMIALVWTLLYAPFRKKRS